jgi:hypothetical protein
MTPTASPRTERFPSRTSPPSTTQEHDQDTVELYRVLGSTMPLTDPEYGKWWASADGAWLYARILTRIGAPVSQTVNKAYGVGCEPADVANTAVTMLRQNFTRAYIRRAGDPWSYLAQMLKRELFNTAGIHLRAELGDDLFIPATGELDGAMTLQEAVEATCQQLAPLTPHHLHPALGPAVTYFAELGGPRISHLYTHATTDEELTNLGLGREHILAIANVVLGSRPRNAETSLIAGFLLGADFDPSSSLMHRKGLKKYCTRMAALESQEMLVG